MEKRGKIKEGHNTLIITLSGDQSFVKIFDDKDELVRHSQTRGASEIEHIADPGEYRVETDGTVEKISSKFIEIEEPI